MLPDTFSHLMELDTELIRLDCAALHIARDAYPGLRIGAYLERLDALADRVAARRPGLSIDQRYEALREVLVEELDYRGEGPPGAADPELCYLNHALERKRGMPITLSAIWIEVGRRLKWPIAGVGLPGHFLVRMDDPEYYIIADPFDGGTTLSLTDCRRLLDKQFDGALEFSVDLLAPVDTRTILKRMLGNLRNIYLQSARFEPLLPVLMRLCAVEPENGRHLQDLAAVCCKLGDVPGAHACLTEYLRRMPEAADITIVRRNLKRLEAAIHTRN